MSILLKKKSSLNLKSLARPEPVLAMGFSAAVAMSVWHFAPNPVGMIKQTHHAAVHNPLMYKINSALNEGKVDDSAMRRAAAERARRIAINRRLAAERARRAQEIFHASRRTDRTPVASIGERRPGFAEVRIRPGMNHGFSEISPYSPAR